MDGLKVGECIWNFLRGSSCQLSFKAPPPSSPIFKLLFFSTCSEINDVTVLLLNT